MFLYLPHTHPVATTADRIKLSDLLPHASVVVVVGRLLFIYYNCAPPTILPGNILFKSKLKQIGQLTYSMKQLRSTFPLQAEIPGAHRRTKIHRLFQLARAYKQQPVLCGVCVCVYLQQAFLAGIRTTTVSYDLAKCVSKSGP